MIALIIQYPVCWLIKINIRKSQLYPDNTFERLAQFK